jgi:hypothetical protein
MPYLDTPELLITVGDCITDRDEIGNPTWSVAFSNTENEIAPLSPIDLMTAKTQMYYWMTTLLPSGIDFGINHGKCRRTQSEIKKLSFCLRINAIVNNTDMPDMI